MNPATLNMISGALGTIGITVVGAVGAAYALFRYLGDKWLTDKFSKGLEALKHAQQQELEQLRLRINTTFDRTVKLHANEFEVLPELWARLNEAHNHVASLTSPYQEYPDLDRLADPAFEHFLSESGLPDYQKDELRNSTERTKDYRSKRFWQSLGRVNEKYSAFTQYFVSKSIFIQPEMKELITQLRDMMWDALLEKETEERDWNPREGRWEMGRRFRKEGPALRDSIGTAIQERLWSSAALPASQA
jgi:hypothetical protein